MKSHHYSLSLRKSVFKSLFIQYLDLRYHQPLLSLQPAGEHMFFSKYGVIVNEYNKVGDARD